MKQALNALKIGSVWLLILFITLEIFLRLYDPFHFHVEGQKIRLFPNKQTIVQHKFTTIRPDPVITANNIGFQGRDYDKKADQFRIFAAGGSTTACDLIATPYTWPVVLDSIIFVKDSNVWVNNAGFSGHTTFGHQILLEDILLDLHPDMILLLAGANDRGLSNISIKDTYIFKPNRNSPEYSWKGKIYFFLVDNSKVLSTIVNLKRAAAAKNNVWDYKGFYDINDIASIDPTPPSARDSILQAYTEKFIPDYKARIKGFVDTCLQHDIILVLVTQPILYDTLVDQETGINLATIRHGFKMSEQLGMELTAVDGLTEKAILDLHNRAIKEVANELQLPIIDLAAKMPKGFTYFYDPIHFTEEGCKEVARIVYEELTTQNLIPQ